MVVQTQVPTSDHDDQLAKSSYEDLEYTMSKLKQNIVH